MGCVRTFLLLQVLATRWAFASCEGVGRGSCRGWWCFCAIYQDLGASCLFSLLFVLHCFSYCIEISFGLSELKHTDSEARFRKKIEQNVCMFQRLFAILNISSEKG